MVESQPLVSVITLTFHKTNLTLDFLKSLQKITYKNIEVIVVDNGPDETSHLIQEQFPNVIYVPSLENGGFGGGNNIGLKVAKGDYFLLVNNDTEVSPGFLEPLLQVFRDYPDTGIVTSKLVYFNSGETLQYAGAHSFNRIKGAGKRIGYLEKDIGQYNKVYPSVSCHGASMIFSRHLLNTIGFFDEEYFVYMDEVDYAERAKKAGFKIFFCGLSTVYHKESITTGKDSPWKTFLMTRNRLLFLKKTTNGIDLFLGVLYFYFMVVPKNLLKHFLKGRFDNMGAMILALTGKKKYD